MNSRIFLVLQESPSLGHGGCNFDILPSHHRGTFSIIMVPRLTKKKLRLYTPKCLRSQRALHTPPPLLQLFRWGTFTIKGTPSSLKKKIEALESLGSFALY